MRRSIAASSRLDPNIAALASGAGLLAGPSRPDVVGKPGSLPHGLEWKARVIGELNTQLLDRARFIDAALRSVEDGLIITSPEGAIGFVNRAAAEILGPKPDTLAGRNLFELLPEARIPEGRDRVEREMVVREPKTRQLVVRASSVTADFGEVIGIVATISDITRQYELQQTKNDVISLVSHEMRTPLTAIQGMTELLADYELDLGRRREMHLAINDEVKRLTRMITEYLDITRLESGATVLRPAPLRLESLLERVLLLLVPVAVSAISSWCDGSMRLYRRWWQIRTCFPVRWRTWSRTQSSTARRTRRCRYPQPRGTRQC